VIQEARQFLPFEQSRGIEGIGHLLVAATHVGCLVISSGGIGAMDRLTLLAPPPGHADISCDARKPRGKLLRVSWSPCATPRDSVCLLRQVFRRISVPSQIRAPSHQVRSLGANRFFKRQGVSLIWVHLSLPFHVVPLVPQWHAHYLK